MTSLTFDSNVWRKVVSPSRFRRDRDLGLFQTLNGSIGAGTVSGFLAETVFTLEQIERGDRKAFLSSYRGAVTVKESSNNNDLNLTVEIGPGGSQHPGNSPIVSAHFADALALGLRILRAPRIAGIVNPDIPDASFASDVRFTAPERNERFGRCLQDIEDNGGGIAHIKAIGLTYAPSDRPWFEGIPSIPPSDDHLLVKAVAEWADGDAIAAHYAYGVDYFCTTDMGISAGSSSVLSPTNRQRLTTRFGIQFVLPSELTTRGIL